MNRPLDSSTIESFFDEVCRNCSRIKFQLRIIQSLKSEKAQLMKQNEALQKELYSKEAGR